MWTFNIIKPERIVFKNKNNPFQFTPSIFSHTLAVTHSLLQLRLYLHSFLCRATLSISPSGVCWSSWGALYKPRNKRTSRGRAALRSALMQRGHGSSRARWWASSWGKPKPEQLSACRRAGRTLPSCSSASPSGKWGRESTPALMEVTRTNVDVWSRMLPSEMKMNSVLPCRPPLLPQHHPQVENVGQDSQDKQAGDAAQLRIIWFKHGCGARLLRSFQLWGKITLLRCSQR